MKSNLLLILCMAGVMWAQPAPGTHTLAARIDRDEVRARRLSETPVGDFYTIDLDDGARVQVTLPRTGNHTLRDVEFLLQEARKKI